MQNPAVSDIDSIFKHFLYLYSISTFMHEFMPLTFLFSLSFSRSLAPFVLVRASMESALTIQRRNERVETDTTRSRWRWTFVIPIADFRKTKACDIYSAAYCRKAPPPFHDVERHHPTVHGGILDACKNSLDVSCQLQRLGLYAQSKERRIEETTAVLFCNVGGRNEDF